MQGEWGKLLEKRDKEEMRECIWNGGISGFEFTCFFVI